MLLVFLFKVNWQLVTCCFVRCRELCWFVHKVHCVKIIVLKLNSLKFKVHCVKCLCWKCMTTICQLARKNYKCTHKPPIQHVRYSNKCTHKILQEKTTNAHIKPAIQHIHLLYSKVTAIFNTYTHKKTYICSTAIINHMTTTSQNNNSDYLPLS